MKFHDTQSEAAYLAARGGYAESVFYDREEQAYHSLVTVSGGILRTLGADALADRFERQWWADGYVIWLREDADHAEVVMSAYECGYAAIEVKGKFREKGSM